MSPEHALKQVACQGQVKRSPHSTPFTSGAPLCLWARTQPHPQSHRSWARTQPHPLARRLWARRGHHGVWSPTYVHFAPSARSFPVSVRTSSTFLCARRAAPPARPLRPAAPRLPAVVLDGTTPDPSGPMPATDTSRMLPGATSADRATATSMTRPLARRRRRDMRRHTSPCATHAPRHRPVSRVWCGGRIHGRTCGGAANAPSPHNAHATRANAHSTHRNNHCRNGHQYAGNNVDPAHGNVTQRNAALRLEHGVRGRKCILCRDM